MLDSESETDLNANQCASRTHGGRNAHRLHTKGILSTGSSSSSDDPGRIPKRSVYPWETKDRRFDDSLWRKGGTPSVSSHCTAEAPDVGPSAHMRAEADYRELRTRGNHRLQLAEAKWKHERERLHDELLCMQRTIAQLEETLEQKNAELADRPTHRDIKLLQNELERLQEKPRQDPARKQQPTHNLVQRDKTIFRINAERIKRKYPPLDEIPRSEMNTFAATVLSVLKVCDLREAERAVGKLCKVVHKSLPQMKSFAEEVFSATKAQDVKSAVTIVHDWADDHRGHKEWLQFHVDVLKVLNDSQQGLDSPGDILQEIRALKEFQSKVAGGKEAYDIMDKDMKENPQELCYRLIRHFMQLFDVRHMDGVLPSMNMVFGKLNELRNFWKSLCVELRLDNNTSPITVLQRLSAVWRPLGVGNGTGHLDAHRLPNALMAAEMS